jgi:2-hydroxy-6-oxonona-2,4-dienedioate hydrolase
VSAPTVPTPPTPPTIQYLLGAGGVTTRVLECGTGDDVVVCLHGAGSRADRWRPVLPLLADAGFRAFALDFPGHGLAAKPAGYAYGSPAFTAFVLDALAALGIERASFLGTSLGGHVTALVALESPATVAAAVLIGAVGIAPHERDVGATTAKIADVSLAGMRAKLELLLEDHSLVTDAFVREELLVNSSPGAADAMATLRGYSAERLDDDVCGERYAELGIPTMLLWGAQDRWVRPSVGDAAAALLPKAPLILLDRTGHAPYFERPHAFTDVVAAFLREPDAFVPGSSTL